MSSAGTVYFGRCRAKFGTHTKVKATFWPCLEPFFRQTSLKLFSLFPSRSEWPREAGLRVQGSGCRDQGAAFRMRLGVSNSRVNGCVPCAKDANVRTSCRQDRRLEEVRGRRGGLVFKAQRLLYHSPLGSRVMKKKRRRKARRTDAARDNPNTSTQVLISAGRQLCPSSAINLSCLLPLHDFTRYS